MMAQTMLRSEDRIGLAVAVGLHVALVVVLALQLSFTPDAPPKPERVTVNLATEVSLESTAPNPAAESQAAIAPTLSPEPAPLAEPLTPPVDVLPDTTPPPPTPRTEAPPRTRAPPRNNTRSTTRTPPPKKDPAPSRPRSQPDPTPTPKPPPPKATERSGGSRIGDDFLAGQGSSTRSDDTQAPAATFGRRERAALSAAISRQLRPHWTAPTGVDAEKLVSIVSWKLKQDGSLSGRPSCRTEANSITDSNKPQVGLHCERAIRAVQLAAPFDLPQQFYSRWDDLEWQFDRRL